MCFVWLSMRSKRPLIVCTCCFIIRSLFCFIWSSGPHETLQNSFWGVLKRIIKREIASEEVLFELF